MTEIPILFNNPVVWIITGVAVWCYSVLFTFGHHTTRSIPLQVVSLDNTQCLLSSLPLLGLLGTIIGLLETFSAMANGVGNQAELMSAGISDAMFTTEVGLLFVIPGWLLLHYQRKALERQHLDVTHPTLNGKCG